jgi:rubrerythrin
MTDTKAESPSDIADLAELLAHAYAIEEEAIERYEMLGDQMEVHNNHELAKLFRELAGHEKKHAAEIKSRAAEIGIASLKPSEYKWPGTEGPELAALDDAHYRMTPWHALQMALGAETRAFEFFDCIVNSVSDPELQKWAEEFRDEEAEHVRLVERLLEKHPKPAADWADDDDPPNMQE